MNHRGSRDTNHAAIAAAFLRLGCSIADLALAGVSGFPDLVVGCMGQTYLVEIKNPDSRYGRAGLNIEQSAFARDWRGGRVYVVTCVDDVIALVTAWRAAVARPA